jgi:2-methylcitrate dehydratase PrpD
VTGPRAALEGKRGFLAQRIEMYIDPGLEARTWETFGATLSIETAGGQTLTSEQPAPVGSPENPMSERQFQQKFRDLAGDELGPERCEALIDSVSKLEETDIKSDVFNHVLKP